MISSILDWRVFMKFVLTKCDEKRVMWKSNQTNYQACFCDKSNFNSLLCDASDSSEHQNITLQHANKSWSWIFAITKQDWLNLIWVRAWTSHVKTKQCFELWSIPESISLQIFNLVLKRFWLIRASGRK